MPPPYLNATEAGTWTQWAQARQITSTGVPLHLDWYPQPRPEAPAVVINHGGGGHAGLFAKLALAFHRAGYAVAVPDQRGQGRSGGARGDFSVAEAVQNIVDATGWVRGQVRGPVHLLGSSIGGGLAYAAGAALACQGQPPCAVACINLYDFGDPRTGLEFSRLAPLARVPLLPGALRVAMRWLARALPRLRVPYLMVADFSAMFDERDLAQGAYQAWRSDPHVVRSATLRTLASLSDTPCAVPLHANRSLAVLVINPRRDRMVAPSVTRRSFVQLGGDRAYHEIDFGHFSLQESFTTAIVALADDWFRRHAGAPTHDGAR